MLPISTRLIPIAVNTHELRGTVRHDNAMWPVDVVYDDTECGKASVKINAATFDGYHTGDHAVYGQSQETKPDGSTHRTNVCVEMLTKEQIKVLTDGVGAPRVAGWPRELVYTPGDNAYIGVGGDIEIHSYAHLDPVDLPAVVWVEDHGPFHSAGIDASSK